MKIATFILSVLLSFLIIQPVFSNYMAESSNDDCCNTQVCAKKKCCKNENKDDCSNNNCNPFVACVCGNFFVAERIFVSAAPSVILNRSIVLRDESILSSFSKECWHPPEVA